MQNNNSEYCMYRLQLQLFTAVTVSIAVIFLVCHMHGCLHYGCLCYKTVSDILLLLIQRRTHHEYLHPVEYSIV